MLEINIVQMSYYFHGYFEQKQNGYFEQKQTIPLHCSKPKKVTKSKNRIETKSQKSSLAYLLGLCIMSAHSHLHSLSRNIHCTVKPLSYSKLTSRSSEKKVPLLWFIHLLSHPLWSFMTSFQTVLHNLML